MYVCVCGPVGGQPVLNSFLSTFTASVLISDVTHSRSLTERCNIRNCCNGIDNDTCIHVISTV